MNWKKIQTLTLNGHSYEGNALKLLCEEKQNNPSTLPWEKHIYRFINEFLSNKNYVIIKTSGSTGEPKLIKLSKDILIQSATATSSFLNLKKDMNALLCLSTEFIAGKMMVVRALVTGFNIISVEPDGNPMNHIQSRIDFAAMVPMQVANALKLDANKKKIQDIHQLIIGGGKIHPKLIKNLRNFPNNVYATYGMTETSSHIALKKLNTKSVNEHYKCLPNISVRTNHENCLIINAPQISNKEFKTRDLAIVYSNSEFEILGRKDNIINSGGIKIIPEELEYKLSSFIDNNFIITSMDDDKLGEKIILLIESRLKNNNQLLKLRKKFKEILHKFETPRQIDFMNTFIYTKSGKVNRELTKKKYLQSID